MTVRVYRSTDYNAPILTGIAGSLIAVLDGCLVNGYGNMTITSLSQVGGLATATTAVAHKLVGNPKMIMSGANQAGYNIEATVTVTGASSFTFPVNSGTVSPATGTLVARHNGSGWTKPFATGNIAAYKQPTGSNEMYLRVDDSTVANVARLVGYETMATNVDGGVNPFPTTAQFSGGLYQAKSNATDSSAREWVLICNGPIFYMMLTNVVDTAWTVGNTFCFGDITSYKAGDAYHTILIASTNNANTSNQFQALTNDLTTSINAHFMARSYTQVAGSVALSKGSDSFKSKNSENMGNFGTVFPNPVDGSLLTAPVWIGESAAQALRGVLPGIYVPLHNKPLLVKDTWNPASGDLVGKSFEMMLGYSSGCFFFETSDTW